MILTSTAYSLNKSLHWKEDDYIKNDININKRPPAR